MRFVRTLVALAAVAVLSMNSVEAGSIIGSQGFSFGGVRVTNSTNTTLTSVPNSNLATAQYFRLQNVTSNSSVGGDFGDADGDPVSLTSFGNLFFNTTVGTGFSFSNAGYGTFQSTQIQKVNENMYYVIGNFTPGSNFSGDLTTNTAEFQISLNQGGGPGNAISGSGSLFTPAIHVAVPEPSSLALACVGGLIGLVAVRRNRK